MLYMHMGMPKTGTTYLQHTFAANQHRLAKNNIDYSRQWRNGENIAQHQLGLALCNIKSEANESIISSFIECQSLRSTEEHTLISSEAITNAFSQNNIDDFVALISEIALIQHIKIIIFIRRLDNFFESMYLHSTKIGEIAISFDEYIRKRENWAVKFFSFVNRLKYETPAVVKIVNFEGVKDLCEVFCREVHINAAELNYESNKRNTKMGLKLQSALLNFDLLLPDEIVRKTDRLKLVKKLEKDGFSFGDDEYRYSIYSKGTREAVIKTAMDAAKQMDFMEYTMFYGYKIAELPERQLSVDSLSSIDRRQFDEFVRSID